MFDRRTALLGIGTAGTLFALNSMVPATARTTSGSRQALMSEDEQLDLILEKLESLPYELKIADPKTYPNYKEEISRYLGDTTVVVPTSSRGSSGGAVPYFNFFACAASLVGFVASTGIPSLKIIGWIRQARALWGSVQAVWRAIRKGEAATEIGEDAAEVLSQILGISDVINACM